jgi:hypothetical protein
MHEAAALGLGSDGNSPEQLMVSEQELRLNP